MEHFVKIAEGLDVEAVLQEIMSYRNSFGHLPYLPGFPDTIHEIQVFQFRNIHGVDKIDYSTIPETKKLLDHVLTLLPQGALGGFSAFGLAAGKQIHDHIDGDNSFPNSPGYFRKHNRYHVVLTTNPDVTFHIGDEHVHMAVGECWRLNNKVLHRVDNFGETLRIHLIIDVAHPEPFWPMSVDIN